MISEINLQALAEKFDDRAYYAPDGHALRYRLFRPAAEGKQPLVLFLHGMGERGSDNRAHITNTGGAQLWADENVQADTPCYILAPQCPADATWLHPGIPELVMAMLRDVCSAENVDTMRLYICGLSMGGCGTWHIAAENPDVFAAALPVCGAASPETAARIGQTPLWALRAADDDMVPIAGDLSKTDSTAAYPLYGSRLAVSEAARSGSRNLRLTEYPAGYIGGKYKSPHAAWEEAFRDDEVRRWLFSQNRMNRDTYKTIVPGVWECCDATGANYYIVEGRDRALVIDTGMGWGDIASFVGSITRLPYALALTHGHGDHSMHCSRFGEVYLDMADKPMLFEGRFPGQQTPDESALVSISDGYKFDLGGGVIVETVALPGHTPGSVLFVDKFHKCVFTGDAVGSGCGVWMQVPGAYDLSAYAASLAFAGDRLAFLGVDGTWAFLGGHANQRFMNDSGVFNPILPGMLSDMRVLCEKLISGELKGSAEGMEQISGRFGETLKASYGTADMLYRPVQLK